MLDAGAAGLDRLPRRRVHQLPGGDVPRVSQESGPASPHKMRDFRATSINPGCSPTRERRGVLMGLIASVDRVERLMHLLESVGFKPDCCPQDMVTDLLTDLRHLCSWADLDFEAVNKRSLMHYEAEVDELESELAE